jgi:nicotinic acid mononucleotide adenylyltransferase
VERVDQVELPVSSSEIRARLAAGEQVAAVPERVMEYIRERGLYRA